MRSTGKWHVTSWAHPAGFTITNAVNAAQQITQISYSPSDATHPQYLIQNATYTPFGALSTLQNGCAPSASCPSSQQALETYDYNNRLQPVRMQLGTSSNTAADYCLVYNYYAGVGNASSCAIPSQASSGNSGNVMGYFYQDSVNPSLGHSAAYTYDSLDRLATAVATSLQSGGAAYSLTFEQVVGGVYSGYDRYGNMTCVQGSTNTFCPQLGYNPATNQLTGGYTYDAAGNLTSDGVRSYTWDAEGRLVSSTANGQTSSWIYNALGQKVEKTSVIPHSYTHERLYDPQGLLMSFWNTSLGDWGYRYVRLGGRPVAFDNEGSNESFEHLNNLGSVTMVTQYNGLPLSDQRFYPWGDYWTGINPSDGIWASTTGAEGFEGLASTPNRDDSLGLGRWLSPDPLAGDISDPQSLNRYAYAGNNPTTLIDPSGLDSSNPSGTCGEFGFAESHAECGGPPPSVFCPPEGGECITIPGIIFGGGGGGGGGGGIPHRPPGPPAPSSNPNDVSATGPGGVSPIPIGVSAGIAALLFIEALQNAGQPGTLTPNTAAQSFCQSRILGDINKVFGTNFSSANSSFFSPPLGTPGAALNVVISAANLAAPQFNALQLGRYPLSGFSYLIGYGPTLHIAGQGHFDPNAVFTNGNVGGVTSVTFTAHLDSAFAYNPIGALLHFFIDYLGIGRNPCP